MPEFTCSTEELAAAFEEWDARYRADPEAFMSEAYHLLKTTPQSYGELCAAYLPLVLADIRAGLRTAE